MGKRSKFSKENKLEKVMAYLEGKESSLDLARRYGCDDKIMRSWVESRKQNYDLGQLLK